MINILVPLAGKSLFFDEAHTLFPKPLTEICGKTMIEHFIENISQIGDSKLIFVIKEEYATKYHLDSTIKLLNKNAEFISLKNETLGMACTSLLAIDYINNNEELIICNCDQIIEYNFNEILGSFRKHDAGVVVFESIHPRYAYVKIDEKNLVLEAIEKKPISRNAIAGFFYFKEGLFFVKASQSMIYKDINYESKYYISPCLNEMILNNQSIYAFEVDKDDYYTFYSPSKITEFERIKNAQKTYEKLY